MEKYCKKCGGLCTCLDWMTGNIDTLVSHIIENAEFTGMELDYHSLEPGDDEKKMCVIGRCRICGRRLCFGTKLPSNLKVDSLLEQVYYWAYHFWRRRNYPVINGKSHFEEIFPSLFHPDDRPAAIEWTQRPENQYYALIRRCGALEV